MKDLSLEIPNAPKVFLEQAQPQLEVRIDTASNAFAEGYYEVTVSATVTAKMGERTLFLVEAAQAGIVHRLDHVLARALAREALTQQLVAAFLLVGVETFRRRIGARMLVRLHRAGN